MVIAALALTAGSALVQAMVTDGWEGFRQKVAMLFGRGQPDPKIDQKLVAARDQLMAAAPSDVDQVQASLANQWQTRFADLLDDYPDAAPELTALVDELVPVTASASDHSISAQRIDMKADRSSFVAGVVHGNVTMPGPSVPGPAGS
jgi:hypothetical protein